jgi:biotin operon repressor
MELTEVARRLHGVAVSLEQLSDAMAAGQRVPPDSLDHAVAQLKGLRIHGFGRNRPPGAARDRIRSYLIQNTGQLIPGEELAEIAGISEWARRLRELRAEGLRISQPEIGMYRLDDLP